MKTSEALFTVGLLGLGVMCGGCVGSSSTPVYKSSQVGSPITAKSGTIVAVREVVIEAPSRSPYSTGPGATIGSAAVAGAMMGNPMAVAGALGGVVGGSAGAKLDNKIGDELTVTLEGGQTIVIVQERGNDPLMPGDRVLVQTGMPTSVYGGGTTQVIRDDTVAAAKPARVW
jgi:outer membrane lipoprotein SlyB